MFDTSWCRRFSSSPVKVLLFPWPCLLSELSGDGSRAVPVVDIDTPAIYSKQQRRLTRLGRAGAAVQAPCDFVDEVLRDGELDLPMASHVD